MLNKRAIVEWIGKDQNGRTKPPLGIGTPAYATVVRFADEPWPPINGAWSLVVVKDEQASIENRWVANVHYLMEEAPHDSLRIGRLFELYEGNKCVARGRITGDEMDVEALL
jgi:hypothetical protein